MQQAGQAAATVPETLVQPQAGGVPENAEVGNLLVLLPKLQAVVINLAAAGVVDVGQRHRVREMAVSLRPYVRSLRELAILDGIEMAMS